MAQLCRSIFQHIPAPWVASGNGNDKNQQVNTTPLIFILSPGTDPVSDVIAFADKCPGHRLVIHLGGSQGEWKY